MTAGEWRGRLRAAMTGVVLLGLTGGLGACASLVRPDVTTETAELRDGAFSLDKAHAVILFKVSHFGLSKYVGRFTEFDASLDFDADNPQASRLEAIIETDSIYVGDPEFEKDLAEDWFDAPAHPQAIFRATALERTGETTGRMTGDLTLRGVTKPITLDVIFNGGANNIITGKYTLGFEANGSFKRSDYGIDNLISAGIGDEIELEIHVEFQRD